MLIMGVHIDGGGNFASVTQVLRSLITPYLFPHFPLFAIHSLLFFSFLLYCSLYFVPENFYSLMDTLSSLFPRYTWNPADLPSSRISSQNYCFNTLTPRNLTPDHIMTPDHTLTTEHDLTSGPDAGQRVDAN